MCCLPEEILARGPTRRKQQDSDRALFCPMFCCLSTNHQPKHLLPTIHTFMQAAVSDDSGHFQGEEPLGYTPRNDQFISLRNKTNTVLHNTQDKVCVFGICGMKF